MDVRVVVDAGVPVRDPVVGGVPVAVPVVVGVVVSALDGDAPSGSDAVGEDVGVTGDVALAVGVGVVVGSV